LKILILKFSSIGDIILSTSPLASLRKCFPEARIDRIGQHFPMTYIDLFVEDTIDERIVKALRKKINIATKIMGEELKSWI